MVVFNKSHCGYNRIRGGVAGIDVLLQPLRIVIARQFQAGATLARKAVEQTRVGDVVDVVLERRMA
eukprot:COSAG06_NODE_18977_length_859_cov_0.953947_2_plen_66_part_00